MNLARESETFPRVSRLTWIAAVHEWIPTRHWACGMSGCRSQNSLRRNRSSVASALARRPLKGEWNDWQFARPNLIRGVRNPVARDMKTKTAVHAA